MSKIDKRQRLESDPFTFKVTKDQKLIIYRGAKKVKIISAKKSADFISLAKSADEQTIQLALAKITGHYKHGNER